MLIFKKSVKNRVNHAQRTIANGVTDLKSQLPESSRRTTKALLPETSELEVVRHYTGLSQKNFAIDTHIYPLGSCTMKYNPRGVHKLAMLPDWLRRHPLAPLSQSQGFLQCIDELQSILIDVTGMTAISLAPMAGAQGEFSGVAMIRAYHQARGDVDRCEMLVPDAAHGTNPASAVMCGFKVREIPTKPDGDIDLEALEAALGPQTAGIMLTNPSTLGVFERQIKTIADKVHQAGGLLYYDGANLNAILGRSRPGDMGFDVMHLNLHKTFATPHGGGGPGAGPVACNDKLKAYLPVPIVAYDKDHYRWLTEQDIPSTIGRLSAFNGNAAILLRAYIYCRLLGRDGMRRVSNFATLNANYLMACLQQAGFELAYPERRASHEFIVTLKGIKKQYGITAMDVAKRLLDYGCHAPTTYFPLLVPECLLIEPTETESKQDIDCFVDAMVKILEEIKTDPEKVKTAPVTQPVTRLDDVKAARQLDLRWTEEVQE